MMYVLALMLGVVGSIYLLLVGTRPWWHAMAGAGILFVLVFLVQLMPIRIGTVLFFNGVMTALLVEWSVRAGLAYGRQVRGS